MSNSEQVEGEVVEEWSISDRSNSLLDYVTRCIDLAQGEYKVVRTSTEPQEDSG